MSPHYKMNPRAGQTSAKSARIQSGTRAGTAGVGETLQPDSDTPESVEATELSDGDLEDLQPEKLRRIGIVST